MKNTIIKILLILSGVFLILGVREDIKGRHYKKQKAFRKRAMDQNYADMKRIVNPKH